MRDMNLERLKSANERLQSLPLDSYRKELFFAIHLFREQIYSVNKPLAIKLATYLSMNRKECCTHKARYSGKYLENMVNFNKLEPIFVVRLQIAHYFGSDHAVSDPHFAAKQQSFKESLDSKLDMTEPQKMQMDSALRMAPVFGAIINEICQETTSVTFDVICDILKRFFMEQSNDIDIKTGKPKWIISFDEILTVYPNLEIIHFLNEYQFNDEVLRKLIGKIEQKKRNNLKRITFTYYDYEGDIPSDSAVFMDPTYLDEALMKRLRKRGWELQHGLNGRTGYSIKLYRVR